MRFSVLQWNTQYFEKPDDIVNQIRSINPDIACLQELTLGYHGASFDTGHYLVKQLQYAGYYTYGPMSFPDGSSGQMGNGILSRFPITAQQQIVLAQGEISEGKVTHDQRIYIEVELCIDGQNISIATTHLPFRPSMYTSKNKKRLLAPILNHLDATTQSIILTGDLNSVPRSRVVHDLKSYLKLAGPSTSTPTWTKQSVTIAAHTYQGLNWRLDYIFYKGKLKPIQAKTLDSIYSDHVPILVEFELI